MVQGLEPLFLLSDVPGDVAMAVGGVLIAQTSILVTAVWRQHLKDQAERQENVKQIITAQHAQADSNAAVARALEAMGRPHVDADRPA